LEQCVSWNSGGQSSHAGASLVRFEHEGYCFPLILLVHELLLDGSQLFSQKVDMNIRPSRLPDPLPPRSRLVPSIAAVSRCTVDRRTGGAVMSGRKVPAVRHTAQNTYALVQYEA
jgi:hypothetical protein